MEEKFEMKGTIREVVPGGSYWVVLENNYKVFCHVSGKMIKHSIKLKVNDIVKVEMSKYDISKGRIIFRERKEVPLVEGV